MSNYFDALLQASGIAVGPPDDRATAARPVQAADFGIEEVIDERPQSAPESSPRLDERLRPVAGENALVGMPAAQSEVSALSPAAQLPQASSVQAQSSSPSAPSIAPNRAPAPALGSVLAPRATRARAQAADGSALPAPDAVMQAALRWVATGDGGADEAPAPAAKPMADGGAPAAREAPYRVQPGYAAVAAEDLARDTSVADSASAVDATVVQLRDALVPPWAQAADGRGPAPLEARADGDGAGEDVVHISIGTIHVRVDAPPPPAVSVASPPLARMAPPVQAPRSGLSRRALRRI
jgi:hypothetical protein